MLEGCAGSEGKAMESQRFSLPLGLPRATRIPPTCGWRGCRTWQGSILRGATMLSLPSAWCTLQPWWLSTWACWRTGNTSLWAVSRFRWAKSSLRGFFGFAAEAQSVSMCWECLHPQSVLTVCCMNEMLLCENGNVYFIHMLYKNRYVLYTLQKWKCFTYIFYKNRMLDFAYILQKIESYILCIYSTKIECHL